MSKNKITKLYVKTLGGEITSAAILAPKIGPLGLSPKKIGEDIAKATIKEWKNITVGVNLIVKKRKVVVRVNPSTSSLIQKKLNDNNYSKTDKNLVFKEIINIAKLARKKSYAKSIRGSILEVLGTCNSMNVKIDNLKPKILQKMIKES